MFDLSESITPDKYWEAKTWFKEAIICRDRSFVIFTYTCFVNQNDFHGAIEALQHANELGLKSLYLLICKEWKWGPNLAKDIDEVFETANTIHGDLMAGASFDSLAQRFSTDKSAGPGGDLGWLKVDELPEFFRDVRGGMKPGDISQVLREPNGFRIVKLLEQEEARPFTYEEVRDDLRKGVEEEKLAESYETYVAGLHDEFYVDVRVD